MSAAFQFFAPETQQDPYALYARARAQEPVFFSAELGIWVATRHADICAILRDTTRFSSRLTTASVKDPPPEVVEVLREGFPRTRTLISLDPPGHTSPRRLQNVAFMSDRIAAMEGTIRELTGRLIDAFEADGRADLVARFSYPLPKIVISDMLGVPRSDIDKFGRWADDAAVLLTANAPPTDVWVQAAEGWVALQRYIAALIEARRREPKEDLLAIVIQSATDQAGQFDLAQAVNFATGFLIAGHKTTTDLLGNAVTLLLKHPEQLEALVRDPGLAPAVVEEALRRDGPVPGTIRVTTEDVQIGGVAIPKDTRILVLLGSGNHDEAVFPEPARFDVRRPNAGDHMSFGRGVHFCIGAPLARLEGRIGLMMLTQRLRNLRFASERPVQFSQLIMFRGPVSLDVAWDVPLAPVTIVATPR